MLNSDNFLAALQTISVKEIIAQMAEEKIKFSSKLIQEDKTNPYGYTDLFEDPLGIQSAIPSALYVTPKNNSNSSKQRTFLPIQKVIWLNNRLHKWFMRITNAKKPLENKEKTLTELFNEIKLTRLENKNKTLANIYKDIKSARLEKKNKEIKLAHSFLKYYYYHPRLNLIGSADFECMPLKAGDIDNRFPAIQGERKLTPHNTLLKDSKAFLAKMPDNDQLIKKELFTEFVQSQEAESNLPYNVELLHEIDPNLKNLLQKQINESQTVANESQTVATKSQTVATEITEDYFVSAKQKATNEVILDDFISDDIGTNLDKIIAENDEVYDEELNKALIKNETFENESFENESFENETFENESFEYEVNAPSNVSSSVVISASFCICGRHKKVSSLHNNFLLSYDKKLLLEGSSLVVQEFLVSIFSACQKELKRLHPSFSILRPSFSPKIVIYMHNLAKFDGYFLLKNILTCEFFANKLDLVNNIKINNVGGEIYQIKIGAITFLDSLKLVPFSLDKLGKEVLNQPKTDYPIFEKTKSFELVQTLFNDPVEKELLLKYNLSDSVLLYKCFRKMQLDFYTGLKKDISEYTTSPSLAVALFLEDNYKFELQTFLKNHNNKLFFSYVVNNKLVSQKNEHEAIFVTKPYYEAALRSAFYGGRNELIKPLIEGKKSFCADANSLYPFGALAPLPYGAPIRRVFLKDEKISLTEFNKMYGFMKITFCSPNDQKLLPVLPRKHPEKRNVYALGSGTSWYFAKEVQLAKKMG
jgi:DNA polymerase type B, organellar and viral